MAGVYARSSNQPLAQQNNRVYHNRTHWRWGFKRGVFCRLKVHHVIDRNTSADPAAWFLHNLFFACDLWVIQRKQVTLLQLIHHSHHRPCALLDGITPLTSHVASSSASLLQQCRASQPRQYSLTNSLQVSEFIGLPPAPLISLRDQARPTFIYTTTTFHDASRKWDWTIVQVRRSGSQSGSVWRQEGLSALCEEDGAWFWLRRRESWWWAYTIYTDDYETEGLTLLGLITDKRWPQTKSRPADH